MNMNVYITMEMMNATETTLYYPAYTTGFIIVYAFLTVNMGGLITLYNKIQNLMVLVEPMQDKFDLYIYHCYYAKDVPQWLGVFSRTFYRASLNMDTLVQQSSTLEARKLLTCLTEMNQKLNIISCTVEKILYIPPPDCGVRPLYPWHQWEPLYRNSYVLLRQTINNIESLVIDLLSSGNFDPSILVM